MLDTDQPIETPEGVEIALRVAGPVPRFYAWMIDLFIRGVVYFVVAIPATMAGPAGSGAVLILMFLSEWFYPVLFEVLRDGSTPGKRSVGLMVMHRDGTPIGWTASILRNLLRFADFLPGMYGFGLVTMLLSKSSARLGDLAAGTVVVYRDTLVTSFHVPKAPPIAPPIALTLDEQRAVIDFVERLPSWTEQRAAELADLTHDLTGARRRESVARLVGLANWLMGRRA